MGLRPWMPLTAALLAGCGTTTYEVIERPPQPFHTYGGLQAIRVEDRSGMQARTGDATITAELAAAIEERMADEEFWTGSGGPLRLICRVVEVASEYSDPKLWGGGGSMTWGRIVLEVEFQTGDDRPAGRIKATGLSEKGGWAVASMAAARRRALQAIVNFIRDNYDAVAPGSRPF